MVNPVDYFSAKEKNDIKDAVTAAELNTSGEIRVHIESKCNENELDRASYWFSELKMNKTKLRNGVLFYMALNDRKFAIIGDVGINAKVQADFWDNTKDLMLGFFKEQKIVQGICSGVLQAGLQLKQYFPYQKEDINELNDDISFGK